MTVSTFFSRLLLAAAPLLVTGLAQAGPMQDIGTGSGPQCSGYDINNSGTVVGGCAEPDGSVAGFVALAPGNSVQLARLTSSRNCSARAITNVGRVVGSCLDNDSLPTAVAWNTASPTTIQSLQALLGGVRTRATGMNHGGVIAGISISSSNIALPVMWRNNETNARALPAGLLGLGATNCVPSDVDTFTSNPNMPNIVGNCPGTNGRPQPILWSPGILGAYAATTLALPSGAIYCTTTHAVNARILGTCDFGAQGARSVLWNDPAVAPLVLTTSPARNSSIDLNAGGAVVGKYQNSNGDTVHFYWDTVTNTRTDIPPLSGGSHVHVLDIGDNGVLIGSGDLGDGTHHAIKWTLSGGTVDLGTLPGGKNSSGKALSQDGCYLTGSSEVATGQDTHAFVQNLCTP